MPSTFCTLEEAWGDQIEEKSPISRVESLIEPVSKEKQFDSLTPQINLKTPFGKINDDSPIVQQCDICNLVLEQLKGCPDCLEKFRKVLLPVMEKNEKKNKTSKTESVIKKNKTKKNKPVEKEIQSDTDDESEEEEETEDVIISKSNKSDGSKTDKIIIYILIGIIVVLLIFEIYMSFNRKTVYKSTPIMQPYYGSSSGVMNL